MFVSGDGDVHFSDADYDDNDGHSAESDDGQCGTGGVQEAVAT
jgi:hypothetical protein